MLKRLFLCTILGTVLGIPCFASGYNYSAQKHLIPKGIGKVFLGMPFRDFVDEVPMGRSEVTSSEYEFVEVKIPYGRKNIDTITIRVHGISREDKRELIYAESDSETDRELERLEIGRIPKSAVVYSLTLKFAYEFDLKKYSLKRFGSDGIISDSEMEPRAFDIEWTKQTRDGLAWVIRSSHEGDQRKLSLHGRIPGTEFDDS